MGTARDQPSLPTQRAFVVQLHAESQIEKGENYATRKVMDGICADLLSDRPDADGDGDGLECDRTSVGLGTGKGQPGESGIGVSAKRDRLYCRLDMYSGQD